MKNIKIEFTVDVSDNQEISKLIHTLESVKKYNDKTLAEKLGIDSNKKIVMDELAEELGAQL